MERLSELEYCYHDRWKSRYELLLVNRVGKGHSDIRRLKLFAAGDVQPYVALGKRLQKDGHRIRIASHETFRSFVTEHGLEFFDIGGNPQDLMSYMVKSQLYRHPTMNITDFHDRSWTHAGIYISDERRHRSKA